MVIKNKLNLIGKTEFSNILSEFEKDIKELPNIVPLVYSSSEVRKSLLSRDNDLRSLLSKYGSTPRFSYIVSSEGNGFLVTVVRKSINPYDIYREFVFRYSLKSVHNLSELQRFQDGLFIRLLEELLITLNLSYFNSILDEALSNTDYSVMFGSDTFYTGYVSFISNSHLVLIADKDSLFSLVDVMKISDEFVVRDKELDSLLVSQSTIEVLGRKSPIISYLLNSGRVGLKKLLKPVYNKTVRQLRTYQSAQGYGYYLEGNSYGVIKRTEYGIEVILDVYNLDTYERDSDVDLLEEVKPV